MEVIDNRGEYFSKYGNYHIANKPTFRQTKRLNSALMDVYYPTGEVDLPTMEEYLRQSRFLVSSIADNPYSSYHLSSLPFSYLERLNKQLLIDICIRWELYKPFN